MRACRAFLLLFLVAVNIPSLIAQQRDKNVPEERPYFASLTDPACAVPGPPGRIPRNKEIKILYFPDAETAAINHPKTLTLHLVFEVGLFAADKISLPFALREDGVWVATVPVQERVPSYGVYWVEDSDTKQADTNHGEYFDIRFCDPRGRRNENGVKYQAQSYTGILAAYGIDRPVDFAKAIAILEEYIHAPDRGGWLMVELWRYKLHLHGNTPEARAALLTEMNKFVTEHAADGFGLTSALEFAATEAWVPTETVETLLVALDHRHDAEGFNHRAFYLEGRAQVEKDEVRKAAMLREIVDKYPDSAAAGNARLELFFQEKDLSEQEKLYGQLGREKVENVAAPLSMARSYLDRNVKLPEALTLLDGAEKIVDEHAVLTAGQEYFPTNSAKAMRATIALVRAGIYLKMGNPAAAVTILGPRKGEFKLASSFYLLGQALEATGDHKGAVECYLEAAVRPWSEQKEASVALQALWMREKMGSKRDLQRRIEAATARDFVQEGYVPRLLEHPAPNFEVTTLRGEHFSNAELKGKIVVLDLWATWCGTCLEELNPLQDFQRQHPEVVVLTVVDADTDKQQLKDLIHDKKLKDLRIAQASPELWQQFGAFGFPNTFVIDKSGKVRTQHLGGMNDLSSCLMADIRAIAQATP